MEKLISLAIKYDREKEGTSFDWSITNGDFENHIYQKYLISKEYGFIQWLVENDKINTGKIDEDRLETIQYSEKERITIYDWLLMLLSIQDSPIDFLLSNIKVEGIS